MIYKNSLAKDIDALQEARSWIGTSFHRHAIIKNNAYNNGGCDCAGLILGIGQNINSIDRDSLSILRNYNYLMNHQEISLLMKRFFLPQKKINVGRILLINIKDRRPHLSVVSSIHEGTIKIIHADTIRKKVIEEILRKDFYEKIMHIFSYK